MPLQYQFTCVNLLPPKKIEELSHLHLQLNQAMICLLTAQLHPTHQSSLSAMAHHPMRLIAGFLCGMYFPPLLMLMVGVRLTLAWADGHTLSTAAS
jgi:hypothetical protein